MRKPKSANLRAAIHRWVRTEVPRLKSAKTTTGHANVVLRYIKPKDTFDHMPQVVHRLQRASTRLATATVNRRLAVLRRVGNIAYKRWRIIDTPSSQCIEIPEANNARHVYLTRAQVERLKFSCDSSSVGKLIVFAAFTGLRWSEMMAFNQQPTLVDGCVRLPARTKNGMPRSVPLHPRALTIAQQMPLPGVSRQRWRVHWDRARTRCGLAHVHWHDLRHTFASWILQKGGSIAELQQLLGHKTVQQTMRYAHLETTHLRKAVNRL